MQLCHTSKLVTKERFMQEKRLLNHNKKLMRLTTELITGNCSVGFTINKYKSSIWMICASNVERRREQWNNYCSDVPK